MNGIIDRLHMRLVQGEPANREEIEAAIYEIEQLRKSLLAEQELRRIREHSETEQ